MARRCPCTLGAKRQAANGAVLSRGMHCTNPVCVSHQDHCPDPKLDRPSSRFVAWKNLLSAGD